MGEVVKSQGTDLYWAPLAGGVKRVVCATGISGLGGARDQIDTTCLDNTEDRTFAGGLGNPGQVTVPFNLHKNETSHSDLMLLKETGDIVSWGIYSSDGTTVPVADSNANLETVPDRISAIFRGYVSDVTVDIAGNDIWKGTVTIQRSGAVEWDLTAA